MIYLDASVLVPIVKFEERSDAIAAMLDRQSGLTTTDFALGEASSAVARLVRMDKVDAALGRAMLAQLDEWIASRIAVEEVRAADVRLATLFVRRFDAPLRMPDALHLAVCRRLGAALLTHDIGMTLAAAVHQIDCRIEG